jgi:hypothetical protein
LVFGLQVVGFHFQLTILSFNGLNINFFAITRDLCRHPLLPLLIFVLLGDI